VAKQTIVVPEIGNFKDVAVIAVLVKPGDRIEIETPLLTLETEKATMDVPSTVAGTVEAMHVKEGGKVSAGSPIADVTVGEAMAADAVPAPAPPAVAAAAPAPVVPVVQPPAKRAAAAPASAPAPASASAPALPSRPASPARGALAPINEAGFASAHASPGVRHFARELGVDLARVRGSGHKGRITADDVKAFVKSVLTAPPAPAPKPAPTPPAAAALPAVPLVDFAAFGPVESKPLTRIQKISGPRLHAAWVNLPHVTQFDQCDITDLEERRKSLKARAEAEGVKLTPLAFILRACARTLAAFARFNASLDAAGTSIVYKKYVHLGFAADTPNGLMVPVIRDADKKDVFALARALAELSEKARKGRLGIADMSGGCFTISSLGGIGGTAFTPIINAPEVAILGVSKASMQPVYRDGAFVPRLLLPLCLSYDHRVIDGAEAARFIVALSQNLVNVDGLLEPAT
jgi:pyruvate dehydrogenase E2 component (dihydrolipoamide acetyltransferase)